MDKIDVAIESIEAQLKTFIGDQKAIIGLSGGIDSTVIAYLTVSAIGKENVIGVVLPYANQSSVDGSMVASELGCSLCNVNIENIVDSFPVLDNNDKLVRGNIMARVRMTVLYQYANAFNGMVIGTTNKTEAQIGYYTKYGDGAVDVEPIANLYKTEVWEVGRRKNVPKEIINKAPSAELWDNQTDEEELGITYIELDKILQGETTNKNKKVFNLITNSEHKRHMPPSFTLLVRRKPPNSFVGMNSN